MEAEIPLFAHPAISLLSVAGSEAAVERSFSAQDSLHTKKRNRLSDLSVQNEMFIRFNSNAFEGIRVQSNVIGGNCVELTEDFDVRPPSHGTVKALFRAIAIAEENEAAPPAAAIPTMPVPMEDEKGEGKYDSELDSDFDDPESDSESGSESDSNDDEKVEAVADQAVPPVSRSASIAMQVEKQLKLTKFIEDVVWENRWTRETNWKGRELANIIEEASIRCNMNITTSYLKKLIQEHVMSP